jgi:hypothetical protein
MMRRFLRSFVLGTLLVHSVGCSSNDGADAKQAACDTNTEACTLEHDFASYALDSGKEVDGVCMSWTMNNDSELWVDTVSTATDGFFHHSNWFWVPEERFVLPDGNWSCAENGFDELIAAVVGGVIFAQSTQTDAESQQFQPGAAIRIPPRARIIANAHLLNTSPAPVETHVQLRLDTVPEEKVKTKLTYFRLNYSDLKIPAQSRSEHAGSCDFRAPYEKTFGDPFSMKLHYVLPHYHALGDLFRLSVHGGANDGEVLHEIANSYGEPLGHTFAEPIDLGAADGLTFTCGYTNQRAEEVGFGIGDQEMCVMLGFAETSANFDGNVPKTEETITSADGTVLSSGSCKVLAKSSGT